MARLTFVVPFDSISVGTSATKTVVAVAAPAGQRIALKQVEIGGDVSSGSIAQTDMEVKVATADGTGTVIVADDIKPVSNSTLGAKSTAKANYTAEPTFETGGPRFKGVFHPQVSKTQFFPQDREPTAEDGDLICLVLTNNAGASIGYSGGLVLEE